MFFDRRPLAALMLIILTPGFDGHSVEKRSTVCYSDLGCFSNDAPFFSQHRPISFLPQSPDVINPTFILYTRKSPTQGYKLRSGNATVLRNSTFKASVPTKLIVHGFLQDYLHATWMQGDYNVIIVDWGSGSFALYGQASANTRVVGALIAQLITFIQNTTGVRAQTMHILGHSLGAHVAGYAGERLKTLGRITGLDPAQPYFQYTDVVVRLDPTDALYVDVIHTDGDSFFSTSLGLGMSQPCGHIDFYPNGGHDQPGCDKEIVGCNHARAYHLAIDSINSVCAYQAFRCDNEDDFNAGRCLPCSGEGCGHMGLAADVPSPPPGTSLVKYYLRTGDVAPYCRYHYKLSLTLANPSPASKNEAFSTSDSLALPVRRKKSKSQTTEMKDTYAKNFRNVYFNPGDTYTYVVTSKLPLGDVTMVAVRWHHDSELLNIFSWNLLGRRHPKLYVDRIKVTGGETPNTVTFCGQGVAIEADQRQTFSATC